MTVSITVRYSSGVIIQRPLPGGTALPFTSGGVQGFTVAVDAAGVDPGAGNVQAKIHLPSETPGDPDTGGYTALTSTGGNGYQGHVPAPAFTCLTLPQWINNLAVTVYVKIAGVWKDPNRTEFQGVCETTMIDVPGTACPWFAFADGDLVGPRGEPVAQHLPPRVRIPDSATGVSITAAGSWRHAPNVGGTSGPQGHTLGTPRPMEIDDYSHPAYNAQQIAQPDAPAPPRNCLVGLLQPNTGITSQIFAIGTGPKVLTFPDPPTHRGIFFGLWDGSQWNAIISNGGNVTVSLKWTTP